MPLLEICTTKYDDDIKPLKLEMNKLAAECNLDGGFKIGEPTSKFGWTFFEMFVQKGVLLHASNLDLSLVFSKKMFPGNHLFYNVPLPKILKQ